MNTLLQTALGRMYRIALPRRTRSALRLQLELLRHNIEPVAIDPPTGNVLVLAPHMDDETFGCGGTLARTAAAGTAITVAYLTDGSKGYAGSENADQESDEVREVEAHLVNTRKQEAAGASRLLGVRQNKFLGFPDTRLAASDDAVGCIAELIAELRPDNILLPFLTDWHVDHWMTNCILIAAAGRASLPESVRVWGYEIWAPVAANAVVDITTTVDIKKAAMQVYASQLRDVDYSRAILGLNAYRSLPGVDGASYGEAFYVAPFDLYRRLYEIATGQRHERCVAPAQIGHHPSRYPE